jgi:hypothetical protein
MMTQSSKCLCRSLSEYESEKCISMLCVKGEGKHSLNRCERFRFDLRPIPETLVSHSLNSGNYEFKSDLRPFFHCSLIMGFIGRR